MLAAHPDVREAAVVGIPDPHWGEAVVAAIVLRGGATLDAGALMITYVRERLAPNGR